MTNIECPKCSSTLWIVDELVPGEITLLCDKCSHKEPVSEDWMLYHDFTAEEVNR